VNAWATWVTLKSSHSATAGYRQPSTHCWHWDMDLRFPIPVIGKAATLTQAGAAIYDSRQAITIFAFTQMASHNLA